MNLADIIFLWLCVICVIVWDMNLFKLISSLLEAGEKIAC